jgi:hypothetical protein
LSTSKVSEPVAVPDAVALTPVEDDVAVDPCQLSVVARDVALLERSFSEVIRLV